MCRTHFVHELETGEIFGLHGSGIGRPQGPHAAGVAPGGVDALFFVASPTPARPAPSWPGSRSVRPAWPPTRVIRPGWHRAASAGRPPPRRGPPRRVVGRGRCGGAARPPTRSPTGAGTAFRQTKPKSRTGPRRRFARHRARHKPPPPAPANHSNRLSQKILLNPYTNLRTALVIFGELARLNGGQRDSCENWPGPRRANHLLSRLNLQSPQAARSVPSGVDAFGRSDQLSQVKYLHFAFLLLIFYAVAHHGHAERARHGDDAALQIVGPRDRSFGLDSA